MKKFIQITAIMLSAVVVSNFAQAQTKEGVELSVIMKPIQILTINNTGGVNLTYITKTDYDEGVTSDQKDHLTVYSTGGFNVTVESKDITLKNRNVNNDETLASSGILITAALGTTNGFANVTKLGSGIPLNTTAKEIISNNKGGVDRNFDIIYKGRGGDAYVNKFFAADGGEESVYNTTVTYTIAAQ